MLNAHDQYDCFFSVFCCCCRTNIEWNFFFRYRYINETGNETKKNFYDTTSDDSRSNHQERLWKEYNRERVSGEKKGET